MTDKAYHQQSPSCSLTLSQMFQCLRTMFTRKYGFCPRDSQFSNISAFDVRQEGNLYIHGCCVVGIWVYEFEFLPFTTTLFTPSYGAISKVANVYDWTLEKIWHS